MNFGSNAARLTVSLKANGSNSFLLSGVTKTELTSGNVMDENSLEQPHKVLNLNGRTKLQSSYRVNNLN